MVLKLDNNIKNEFIDGAEILPIVHKSIELKFNVGFRGPTGCGKTYLVQELAKQYGKTLRILNMTVDTEIEEIKGRLVPTQNKEGEGLNFKWVNGVLVEAMLKGDWIVIEEANFMNEEMASVFYSIMDHRRNVQLDEHENELIRAHDDFRLFLTMNWGYKGTTQPNDAIRNRVDAWFDLTYLPEEKEMDLLIERTKVEKGIARKIVEVANQFRTRDVTENLPDISTRILLRWSSMVKGGIKPEIAAEHNIIPLLRYDESEKMKIREVIKTAFERPEEVLSINKPRQMEIVTLGDGNSCAKGDMVEFMAADGTLINDRIIDILSTPKSENTPNGIKIVLEKGGWMEPSKLRKIV